MTPVQRMIGSYQSQLGSSDRHQLANRSANARPTSNDSKKDKASFQNILKVQMEKGR